MKKRILFGAMALLAGSLIAADSSPKDEVTSAAKKLADQANYSWRSTMVVPEDSPFHPGPTDGQTEKDGYTHVTLNFGDNTTEFVLKGDKAAVTNPDGGWESLSDMEGSEGPGRFLVALIRNFKAPAAQATELASFAKELTQKEGVYSSDLTEAGAKSLLTFRRGGGGPSVSNAKGWVKFWLKDGMLTKYQFKLQGTISFNENDIDVDRTTTVEIKDVGKTKVTVSDAAKKKLS